MIICECFALAAVSNKCWYKCYCDNEENNTWNCKHNHLRSLWKTYLFWWIVERSYLNTHHCIWATNMIESNECWNAIFRLLEIFKRECIWFMHNWSLTNTLYSPNEKHILDLFGGVFSEVNVNGLSTVLPYTGYFNV